MPKKLTICVNTQGDAKFLLGTAELSCEKMRAYIGDGTHRRMSRVAPYGIGWGIWHVALPVLQSPEMFYSRDQAIEAEVRMLTPSLPAL